MKLRDMLQDHQINNLILQLKELEKWANVSRNQKEIMTIKLVTNEIENKNSKRSVSQYNGSLQN